MSIKIEVKEAISKTKSGVSARTSKPYTIREQEAWAYTVGRDGKPHPYPVRISITLNDDQTEPYPVGNYTISPASFYANRFNGLECGLILQPLAAAARQAA